MHRETTCCFTGHRTRRLPWQDNETDLRCIALKVRLRAALEDAYQQGYRHFICGMAQGCDLYFCEALLPLRRDYPDVTIEAAIPFPGQADHWPRRDRLRWDALVRQCDKQTVLSPGYHAGCMARRNRYMVERSSLLLAVYDGIPKGGTRNTLQYARGQGLTVRILSPMT